MIPFSSSWRRLQTLFLILMLAPALAACGGGGGGSGAASTAVAVPLTNFTAVTVDAGPAALDTGTDAYTSTNVPFVTVTICAPGSTSNCQTIDHVLLDTGSVGLRLLAPVVNAGVLGAMPAQTDPAGNPVGECYTFVDDYVFGSVRSADVSIGGESVSALPLQVIGDTGAFADVPSTCSSGGGSDMDTVKLLGANGILGIGSSTTDCGTYCTAATGQSSTIYYDCPATGCASEVARAANTTAPFQQLPNPVAAFAVDNNGTILSLPSVAAAGATSVSGTLYFGIGTQTNNALGSATVLTTDTYGELTATYNGQKLTSSFLDSGSNYLFFSDSTIAACTNAGYTGFYCPTSPLALSPTLTGRNAATASAAFTLYNAETAPAATANAIPGIGANPSLLSFSNPVSSSFDFGLPFFYGRNVYTAIAGRTAGSTVGPYTAF